ncbi:hypothetical protein DPMN_163919 [Dreissena polymorpha]|uniref:OTU domain-containing protein n=1 Tax=Dreissena polymorpha TaxID=45954 RepID=A0A9D4IT92_DREPO|nr:hypothetical protein DPMN_163919 [Dreissena polymorpha]
MDMNSSNYGTTTVHNPEGDGDCQFNAISNKLTRVNLYQNAASLREIAITHLEKHRYYYKDFVQGDMYQYLQSMRQPTTYEDHLTLAALSRELNCQILILNSEGIGHTRLVSNDGDIRKITPVIHWVTILKTLANNMFPYILKNRTSRDCYERFTMKRDRLLQKQTFVCMKSRQNEDEHSDESKLYINREPEPSETQSETINTPDNGRVSEPIEKNHLSRQNEADNTDESAHYINREPEPTETESETINTPDNARESEPRDIKHIDEESVDLALDRPCLPNEILREIVMVTIFFILICATHCNVFCRGSSLHWLSTHVT